MRNAKSRRNSILVSLAAGWGLLQVGSCTTQDVQVQLANGLKTALNGLFNITSTAIANEVFDVDD